MVHILISALATLLFALAGCTPGLIVARRANYSCGLYAACATASLVSTMLLTALVGRISALVGGPQLPAWILLPVALLCIAGAWLVRRPVVLSQPERQGAFEWHGFMYAAAMLAYGFLAYALAFANTPEGGLLVHSYYNADWFKHMGHVHALAAHGIPARDIFGGGEALHYYWLSYILPGAGTAIGGDGWASLFTANAVFVTLFSLLFYGVIRRVADSPRVALFVVFLGTLVSAPLIYAIRTVSGEALQTMVRFADAPAPALLILPQVIPQHTLVLALLLGWAVTVGRSKPENEEENRATWLLIRLGLASTLAISTLLGAMALAAYGLTTLWQHRAKAIAEVAVMALLSGMIVLALGVLQFGNPDSGAGKPALPEH